MELYVEFINDMFLIICFNHAYMILSISLFMHYLYVSLNQMDVILTFCSSPLLLLSNFSVCYLCLQVYRMSQFQAKARKLSSLDTNTFQNKIKDSYHLNN